MKKFQLLSDLVSNLLNDLSLTLTAAIVSFQMQAAILSTLKSITLVQKPGINNIRDL